MGRGRRRRMEVWIFRWNPRRGGCEVKGRESSLGSVCNRVVWYGENP